VKFHAPGTSRLLVILAFGAVYLLWGSNYLAIKFAVASIPPLTLAAVRSLVAGVLLMTYAWLRGSKMPGAREWRVAVLVGGLMFLCSHGGLFWAVTRVPSGIAALLFATMPIWMTLAHIITHGVSGLGPGVALGLVGGTAGVAILVGPGIETTSAIDPLGAVVVVAAAIAWSAGSAVARQTGGGRSVVVSTGSYLLGGGILLLVAAWLTGELGDWDPGAVTPRSAAALAYLIVCGSIIAFGAYNWLLRRQTLVAVSSYAYVHPIVAILLGWLVAGEPVSRRIGLAAALIIVSVALLISVRARPKMAEDPDVAPKAPL
jgi:drug/metabolite transporter (DMT)-like permease